jgi:hypothetical protein
MTMPFLVTSLYSDVSVTWWTILFQLKYIDIFILIKVRVFILFYYLNLMKTIFSFINLIILSAPKW